MDQASESLTGGNAGSPWVSTLIDRAHELIRAGGPVVVILMGLSVVVLAVLLVKLWQFRACRIGDRRTPRDVIRLYRAGTADDALAAARQSPNPTARMLGRAIVGLQRRLPERIIREEIGRYGADALEGLRSGFRPVEVVASLAPLLGLFGTVLGMITAFQRLESAGGQVNPAILSGGIWEALLTTAVGLAIAIPAVVILAWLERRVDRLAHDMENFATQLFTEDLSEPTKEDEDRDDARLHAAQIAA